jgi:hypothetical protein
MENLENVLASRNRIIYHKDLVRYFQFVKTDKDLDLFLKGMMRYQSQQKESDPRLAVPLMQFFYVSNRTEKALELFMSKVGLFFVNSVNFLFTRVSFT